MPYALTNERLARFKQLLFEPEYEVFIKGCVAADKSLST
jgi:hypothetical protein